MVKLSIICSKNYFYNLLELIGEKTTIVEDHEYIESYGLSVNKLSSTFIAKKDIWKYHLLVSLIT